MTVALCQSDRITEGLEGERAEAVFFFLLANMVMETSIYFFFSSTKCFQCPIVVFAGEEKLRWK